MTISTTFTTPPIPTFTQTEEGQCGCDCGTGCSCGILCGC